MITTAAKQMGTPLPSTSNFVGHTQWLMVFLSFTVCVRQSGDGERVRGLRRRRRVRGGVVGNVLADDGRRGGQAAARRQLLQPERLLRVVPAQGLQPGEAPLHL